MKESIKTVFQCDFCDKRLFIKIAMVKHEAACSRNPINRDACGGCAYCKEVEVKYEIDTWDGGDVRTAKGFHCNKLNIDLYPHKVIAKGILAKYPETFEDKQVMPNECEHWDWMER